MPCHFLIAQFHSIFQAYLSEHFVVDSHRPLYSSSVPFLAGRAVYFTLNNSYNSF